MKISIIGIFVFIQISLSAQYYFHEISVTKDVVSIEEKRHDNSLFGKKEKRVYYYQNGNLLKFQKMKGKNVEFEEKYLYRTGNLVDTIIRYSPNKAQNTITINTYDEQNQLKESALFSIDDLETPILVQFAFKYHEEGKLESYHIANPKNKHRKLSTKCLISYEGAHFSKEIKKSPYFRTLGIYESNIQRDSINREAVITNYNFHFNGIGEVGSDRPKWLKQELITIDDQRYLVWKETTKYKYLLDERGNWVKFYSVNKKGKEKLLSERIITYAKD